MSRASQSSNQSEMRWPQRVKRWVKGGGALLKRFILDIVTLLQRAWRWLTRHSAPLVLVLAFLTISSAFVGVWDGRTFDSFTTSFYQAGQAVLLNMEPHADTANWSIRIARISAVLLAALVATKAIGMLFKQSFVRMRLALPCSKYSLICGLGRIGTQVAKLRLKNGELVVITEIADPNQWTRQIEEKNAIVVQGDATDSDTIADFVANDPQTVYLVTGDDHANITALVNLQQLRAERPRKWWDWRRPQSANLPPLECYVHISNSALQSAVDRVLHDGELDEKEIRFNVRVNTFNIFYETACQLIIQELTPIRPRKSNEVAMYVIVGFGEMGKALVKELAEQAHFENEKRSRILVLTENAKEECNSYLRQWGQLSPPNVHSSLGTVTFDPECDDWGCRKQRPAEQYRVDDDQAVEYAANVHFCELHPQGLTLAEIGQLLQIAKTVEGGDRVVRPAVLFCFDDDRRNFTLANRMNDVLQQHYGCNIGEKGQKQATDCLPIFAFMPKSLPLRGMVKMLGSQDADLADSPNGDQYNAGISQLTPTEFPKRVAPLTAFGDVYDGITRVHDSLVEELAMRFAWEFDAEFKKNSPVYKKGEYELRWRSKPYWERLSNLLAAEHARIKLGIFGVRLFEPSSDSLTASESSPTSVKSFQLTQNQVELLARIEHNRWMAERLLMDWKHGARNECPPQRPSLCAFERLAHVDKDKDIQQVKQLFNILDELGYHFSLLDGQKVTIELAETPDSSSPTLQSSLALNPPD